MAPPGAPNLPAIEATLTMWPVPRGFIRRIASLEPWMTAWRLSSSWRIAVASDSSSNGPIGMIPALLTTMSIGPSSLLDAVERGGEGGPVGDVEGEADRAAAGLGRGGLGDGAVEVGDRHAHALTGEGARDRLADAAAAAGDDGDLSGQGAGLFCHAEGVLLGKATVLKP